jgi:glycosyltransferase involved in cell wall biosynthesis
MSDRRLYILNVSIDRDLLASNGASEVQCRQMLYAMHLPATLTHLVKAPAGADDRPIALGSDVTAIPCPVAHWTLFFFAAVRTGARLLRRQCFDLIQAQEPYLCGLVGAYLSWRFRVPLVVGVFGDEIDNPIWLAERPLNRLANVVSKWVLRRASAVRVDSRTVAANLERKGYRGLAYIPFLITYAERLIEPCAGANTTRARLLAGRAGPLVLAVSRLEPEKNIPLMLEAFADVSRRFPDSVLAIAGTGRLAESLRTEGERLAPGRIRWLGWVANVDMSAYYQAADLFLLSSNRESAARVLSESLLAGTPVLTTDTAGAREVVVDGVSGRITPVGDLVAFSSALSDLLGDVNRLAAMGRAGRDAIRAYITAEAVSRDLRGLYERALAR